MGIERHGDDRRVVGPVFEERAPPFQQVVELLRPVASAPGGQNHMVGTLDRGDAVDLDEAQPLDQPCKIFSLGRAPEAVPVEEQLPGSPVGEARQRLAGTATHENLAPIPRTRSQSPHSLQGQEFFGSLPGPNRPPANNDEPASEPAPPRVSLECAGVRCWQDRRQHRQLLEAAGFRARHHVGPPASYVEPARRDLFDEAAATSDESGDSHSLRHALCYITH